MKRIRRSYATLDRNSDKDETPRHEACEKRRREKIDEDESTSAAKALGSHAATPPKAAAESAATKDATAMPPPKAKKRIQRSYTSLESDKENIRRALLYETMKATGLEGWARKCAQSLTQCSEQAWETKMALQAAAKKLEAVDLPKALARLATLEV